MGRSCDVSKQRKCLMKTLKKLSEKLQSSPPCHLKPYPCTPCCSFLPCGPARCKCVLMKNCCQKSSCCSTSCCGPFPDSCTSICCPSSIRCTPKCSCCNPCCQCNTSKCCRSSKCCKPKRCCCCKPCFPMCHPCPKMCKYTCCKPCCCCWYAPSRCRKTCKKGQVGNLCLGCNTICIPRCSSDTCLVTKKQGKALGCSKSVELRGGKLYRGCDCDKKNGLQDRCLRYCCINNPKCRTQPASCHCSKFSCGKHLRIRYGKKEKSISYTCCMCGPPMYPCCPVIPCRCSCCCRCCCENDCQCCPKTCEAACCCQPCPEQAAPPMPCLPCPEPCPPEPEPCCAPIPCPEPCCPTLPCPEPCSPSIPCPEPCCETNSPTAANCVCPYEANCTCDGDTQTYGDNDCCYIEYSPPKCRACQTHY